MATVTDEIRHQVEARRLRLREACAAGDEERAIGALEALEDLADVARRVAEADMIRRTPWDDIPR